MIESLAEIRAAFSGAADAAQFDELLRMTYQELYGAPPEPGRDLEGLILLKIALVQKLRAFTPAALLPRDTMPLLNEGPAAVGDQRLYDRYRCPVCSRLMAQCYAAECGHKMCLKCINATRPTECVTCGQHIRSYKCDRDTELFVQSLQFVCPFCEGEF